jgi:hypothetical protein
MLLEFEAHSPLQAVMDQKQPRKLFVQPCTTLAAGAVEYKDYPPTPEGLLRGRG